MNCPICGNEAYRDSGDVGVGVIYGPYGGPCGWSEDEKYDTRNGREYTARGLAITMLNIFTCSTILHETEGNLDK